MSSPCNPSPVGTGEGGHRPGEGRQGKTFPCGEETREGGRANKSKYPEGIKAPEARHSCRTPIHKKKSPVRGGMFGKISYPNEKRRRAAAVQDAGAFTMTPTVAKRLGVRQSSCALERCRS